jgi:hypothetical protein
MNSTAEFLNYHCVLGLAGDRKPDLVWYRLAEARGGCPVIVWGDLQRPEPNEHGK